MCLQMEQVVFSKRIRRTDQDWSKYLPTYKSFSAFPRGYQTNFGGRIIAAKRRAAALPAAQAGIPREHVTLKFRDEDAEAMEIPVPLEILAEATKKDVSEKKPSGEETPSKRQTVFFTDETTFEKVKAFPSTSLPAKSNHSHPIFIEITISAAKTKRSI